MRVAISGLFFVAVLVLWTLVQGYAIGRGSLSGEGIPFAVMSGVLFGYPLIAALAGLEYLSHNLISERSSSVLFLVFAGCLLFGAWAFVAYGPIPAGSKGWIWNPKAVMETGGSLFFAVGAYFIRALLRGIW